MTTTVSDTNGTTHEDRRTPPVYSMRALAPYGAEKIRPVLDRIFAVKEQRPETSKGGIVLPTTTVGGKDLWPFYRVIAVGPDVKADIKPGDRIVFQQAIKWDFGDGFCCWALPENQLLAVQSQNEIPSA